MLYLHCQSVVKKMPAAVAENVLSPWASQHQMSVAGIIDMIIMSDAYTINVL
jgi:hypothetical protein